MFNIHLISWLGYNIDTLVNDIISIYLDNGILTHVRSCVNILESNISILTLIFMYTLEAHIHILSIITVKTIVEIKYSSNFNCWNTTVAYFI